MSNQSPLLGKEQLRSPAALLFVAVYLFALVLTLWKAASLFLAYIGLSLGIVLLAWLAVEITKKLQIEEIRARLPGFELVFAVVIFLLFEFVPFPSIDFGGKWNLDTVVRKEVLLFILPCVFLLLRENSLSSMGLSLRNWSQNLKVGGLTFVCMAVPSAFFVGDTATLILNGEVSLTQAVLGFPILFFHNIAMSGLPEEFFYRAFIQTRLAQILRSKLGAILITSLVFGLVHIPDLMRWYPDLTLPEAFCRAFFIQGFMGLLLGVIWARTHSLLPGMIVHSGINALNNLGSVSSLVVLP